MADEKTLAVGDGTKEAVALKLYDIAQALADVETKDAVLDLYAECLAVVQNPHARLQEMKQRR